MPTYLGMPAFPDAAKRAVANSQLRRNLTHATTAIRTKRAKAVAELEEGLVAVAAPVFDPAGTCVAALSVSGPEFRMRSATLDALGRLCASA